MDASLCRSRNGTLQLTVERLGVGVADIEANNTATILRGKDGAGRDLVSREGTSVDGVNKGSGAQVAKEPNDHDEAKQRSPSHGERRTVAAAAAVDKRSAQQHETLPGG